MRTLLSLLLLGWLAQPIATQACCISGEVYVYPYGAIATNTKLLVNFQARDYFPVERLARHPLTFVLLSQQGLEIGVSVNEAFQSAGSYTQLLLQPHCELTVGDSLRLKVEASDTLFLPEKAYRQPQHADASAWEEARKRRRLFQFSVARRRWLVAHPADHVAPRFPDVMQVQTKSEIYASTKGHNSTFTFPPITEPTNYLLFEVHLDGRKAYCYGNRSKLRLYQSICGANIRLQPDQFYELEVVPMDFAGNRGDTLLWSFWTASPSLTAIGSRCSSADSIRTFRWLQEITLRLDTISSLLARAGLDSLERQKLAREQVIRSKQISMTLQDEAACVDYRQSRLPRQVARQRKRSEIPLLRRL